MRSKTTNRLLSVSLTVMALGAVIVSGCQKESQPPAGSALTDGTTPPAVSNVPKGATISEDQRRQMQAAQQSNAAARAAQAPPVAQ